MRSLNDSAADPHVGLVQLPGAARLALALVAYAWDDYWFGPLTGGAIAGLVYYFVYLTRDDQEAVTAGPMRT